jgi:hypothetical protein
VLNRIFQVSLLLTGFVVLSACGEGEGEVAKNIKFKVSSGGVVLPSDLSDEDSGCNDSDISGPRVRMRSSIIWSGSSLGNLYPASILATIQNSQLSGEYEETKGPQGDDETISSLFGLSSDFIPPDGEVYSSSSCFLDWGGLPKPSVKLQGRSELRVRGTLLMTGVARTSAGVESPFVKETDFEIIYMAGSVPVD